MRRFPNHSNLPAAIALAVAAWLSAPCARADEPQVYALVNARIVPVSSAPIEKGTVVIRKGIIEAVGTNLAVPADARVIDAAKLTVYPGLIDALSDVALEEPRAASAAAAARPGVRTTAPPSAPTQESATSTPDERQGLTPYLRAADVLNPANRKIEAARAAGITTALVAPRRGFFQGQSALVNLSGTGGGRMVVKTPVALHIGLQTAGGFGGGSYPGSLMGVLAFVKQTLLDSQHYEVAWSTYSANRGAARPEYSRALEALEPVIKHELAVVLPGDTPAEIDRALRLAETFNLRMILSGGAEAARSAALLKEKRIPVLLSAKYPERDRDADPEEQEELAVLRRRMEAPATAAALQRAGVPFAFQSGDMTSPRDFIHNVARSIEAGLERAAALRALTLAPAEIFGVADRIGSIERGKAANLVVATGDIFDARTRVKQVFIDGRKFDIPEEETPRPFEGRASRGEQ
ncbi:MAG: amidohydrolase [Acidobacteria bacterium]|nr:MAG: amidohydrolase [Acidobacteriota bacterium]